jgi:chorismate mutase/prephenate dehydratase
VENSRIGGVMDTLDSFIDSPVKVCAEINLRIHHNVLSRTPLAEITKIYSKPEVFDQCKAWLMETGMLDKTVAVASSSKAAELAAQEAGAAAIGSTLAAELYDLPILVPNVEENPQNTTRFFVLGKKPARRTGADKTVLMFSTAHQAGALVEVLDAFRRNQVNMTMITSRPSQRRNWEYLFFVDTEGHSADDNFAQMMREAQGLCTQFVVLGSYPKSPEFD